VALLVIILATALAPFGHRAEALVSPTDRLWLNMYGGTVEGHLTPNAAYTVTVKLPNGSVKTSVAGRTDAAGLYRATVGYDTGRAPGVHNGDTVEVFDAAAGRTYRQRMQLVGILEEDTGLLAGTAVPGASLKINLYNTGGSYGLVRSGITAKAGADGTFRVNLAALHTPASNTYGNPPWRGYHVDIESSDVKDQATWRQIQTVNTTLVSTRNHAGGGYFLANDNVTFELWRNGSKLSSAVSSADGDGIPDAVFSSADVGPGDVMLTRYHDASGRERTQVLNPWNLTATVDLAAETISGVTEPGAPVVGYYYQADGRMQAESQRAFAAADGSYTMRFTNLDGNRFVAVFRVAEPGFTGVGAQQVELRTPVVKVDDVLGQVSGYGAAGVNPVRAEIRRNGATVNVATGTSAKDGSFKLGSLYREVLPGDQVVVTTGPQVLPSFSVGIGALTAHRVPVAGGSWRYEGSGTPSRQVSVIDGGCAISAIVDATGTWSAPITCAMAATDAVLVTETELVGASAGSLRGRYEYVTQPDVRLTSPTVGAAIPGPVTITADAVDYDEGPVAVPASQVDFFVDGRLVGSDTTAPFSVTAPVSAGQHIVMARAYDAGKRVLPGYSIIAYGDTGFRTFTVTS
jgi:hypothetical protein